MNQTYLAFNPLQPNAGRKSGFGVWRVVCNLEFDDAKLIAPTVTALRITTVRPYRVGVICNPARLALDYVRSINNV